MTTDTPRTDAEITKEAKIVKLTKQNYHGLAKTKAAWYETMKKIRGIYEEGENSTTNTPRTDAFFNRTDIEWDDEVLFARQLERELSASKAEVERLRSTLCRALEIADEFWDNQKQAVLVYHQELADELDQINLKHRRPRSRGLRKH